VNTVPLAKANSNLALLVTKGKAQGYLTYEELNELLPDDAIAPDRLDALMQQFDELGIELLDEAEGNKQVAAPAPDEPDEAMMKEAEDEIEKMEEIDAVEAGSKRIDDPVRMYLTQMGEIPLLTRDEEIRLAKKIELTRMAFRRKVLESDYCLQSAVDILAQVESGELPFDRTMRISTAEVDAKRHDLQAHPGKFEHRPQAARTQSDGLGQVPRARHQRQPEGRNQAPHAQPPPQGGDAAGRTLAAHQQGHPPDEKAGEHQPQDGGAQDAVERAQQPAVGR
jgi:hypothetical protein